VELVEAELLEKAPEMLDNVDCILIPGGFGHRGIPGKLQAIKRAREQKIPLLGICLGLQCMVIEYARNVLKFEDADSVEMNPETTHPVVHLMHDQRTISAKGGTMRLGSYPCRLLKDSITHQLYGKDDILERHRHRYEFNNLYREDFATSDLKIVGTSPDDLLVEMVELQNHPFFIGCQFHPEFQSQIAEAHPLFKGLIAAALKQKESHA
jgi:CTP synthase